MIFDSPRLPLVPLPRPRPTPRGRLLVNLNTRLRMHSSTLTSAPIRISVARAIALLAAFALALLAPLTRAAETGSITGAVSNTQTGNMLEGAKVEIAKLNISVLTDGTGRYVISNVPPGTYEVVARYLGLDPMKYDVTITAGQPARRDFEMTSGIYKLDAFKVTGEREGNAQMITEKKNADNVKDVIAMDSFGYLPNMSAGEVVARLPGVAGSPTDEGLSYAFNIRGMGAALNNVTVDGGSMTTLGTNRAFELQSITGAMFDALELIKGQTPDKGADSLGGTINFKTRSTFSMRENSRTTYNFSTRWAPPFFEQTPVRSQHRAHPVINLTQQNVFSVFGGQRNLGVSVNLFYSENAVGSFETVIDRTNVAPPNPAPVFNYQTWDNMNNRKQQSINFRTDYKWSNTTKFSLTVLENDNFERHRRRVRVTAATGGNTTVPSGATGIVPGAFNSRITVVRPLATTNTFDVQMDGPLNYYVRQGRVDFGGEHNYQDFLIEYVGGIQRHTLNTGQGRGGQLNMRYFDPALQTVGRPVVFGGMGWVIDQTKDEVHPEFRQNGGADFTNPNNYLPRATDGLTQARNEQDQLMKQFRLDMKWKTPLYAPIFFKTGFHWRSLQWDQWQKDEHRWTLNAVNAYDPNVHFAPDPSYLSYDRVMTGRANPFWQAEGTFTVDGRPKDPTLWTEDRYYNESRKYINTKGAKEQIGAEYFMFQGRLGTEGWLARAGFLAGVRFENVNVRSFGWVRARTGTTAAQQLADPVGSATKDYANTDRVLYGKFQQKFPSAHTYYDVTRDLKVRLSYSTGYGRASMSNFTPGETIVDNATTHTITINNPGLRPQQAKNWDATLEYYISEPAGSITFGWFHKDIRDFILTNQFVGIVPGGTDNGYDGDYEGFNVYTSLNAGRVSVQGWEFGYNQQLTFLPGLLKGLAATYNYSWVNQYGVQSGTRYLTKRDITGFIPIAWNAGLRWNYRKYGLRALYNHTGENVVSFSTTPSLSQFRYSMNTLNLGATYRYKPALEFTADVSNALKEPQRFYIGDKDRLRRFNQNFVTLTFAVNGRF